MTRKRGALAAQLAAASVAKLDRRGLVSRLASSPYRVWAAYYELHFADKTLYLHVLVGARTHRAACMAFLSQPVRKLGPVTVQPKGVLPKPVAHRDTRAMLMEVGGGLDLGTDVLRKLAADFDPDHTDFGGPVDGARTNGPRRGA